VTAANAAWKVDTYVREFKDVDRAVLDSEKDGFVKLHVRKGRMKSSGQPSLLVTPAK